MSGSVLEPSWFERAFEAVADLVVAFDPLGQIVYLNSAAERALGVDRDEVTGQSIVGWLHPDDLPRALEVIGLLTGGEFDLAPITPALYRIRRADGSWVALEVNGSRTSPTGSGDVVTICRYNGDRVLRDQVFESLTRGDRFEDVVALLPELGRWRHPTERYAVTVVDDDGHRIAPGSDLPPELDGRIDDGDGPWARALVSGEEVVVESIDELPDTVREAAAGASLRGVRVVPVQDFAGEPGATITAWSTTGGPPLLIHTYALDIMRRVLALVLRWRQQVRQLTKASLTDHLTGVASRSRFFEALEPAGGHRSGPLTAVLYVDLDRFKPVNDRHGHRRGDEVLVVVAARLTGAVRPTDLVARLGGDEFAVLCRGLSRLDEATAIADRILEAVGQPVQLGDVVVDIDASVGIAVTDAPKVDGDGLLDAADRALYRAKREGRGRWALA